MAEATRSAIEKRSIDWVPETERHGRLWTQGPFWFMGNFQPFTVGIGLLGPTAFGLTVAQKAVAGILGILLGTGFMPFHASQGPNFGLPQMIQSRAQFGYRGVILALFATGFTFAVGASYNLTYAPYVSDYSRSYSAIRSRAPLCSP